MDNNAIIFEIFRDLWQILLLIFGSIATEISLLLTTLAFGILFSFSIDEWFEDNKKMIKQSLFIIKSFFAVIATITFRFYAKWNNNYEKVCVIF